MIDFILEPLQYAFMVRGLFAAVMVGIVCAVVGTYVVLRGMAFFGDALAHAILPGIAVGYLVGNGARGPLFWWALVHRDSQFTWDWRYQPQHQNQRRYRHWHHFCGDLCPGRSVDFHSAQLLLLIWRIFFLVMFLGCEPVICVDCHLWWIRSAGNFGFLQRVYGALI